MCGIIGFTGKLDAVSVLTKGLKELEYRGYDSAGIAFFDQNQVKTIKTAGKVSCLSEKISKKNQTKTSCGIGHTRWATHGGVSNLNSHPHTCGKITLIHNGIIENYKELQHDFNKMGITPISQTDSELAAMVLNDCYNGNPIEAIQKTVKHLDGSYAFCILFDDIPDTIYAIRKGSPLVAASFTEGSVIASDLVALLDYSKEYFVLPEGCIAQLTKDNITLTSFTNQPAEKKMLYADWDVTAARKNGYDTFMLKEIHDQPEAFKNTVTPRIKNLLPNFETDQIPDSLFTNINRIIITACGTAMHAGLIGKNRIEQLAKIPVSVEIASEFRYSNPIIDAYTLVITISQSGETADTLAALRLAKELGAKTLSIVNVKGSSIARESDYVLYTHAGPEIAVASTKAYMVQLAAMYLLAYRIAYITVPQKEKEIKSKIKQFEKMDQYIEKMFDYSNKIEKIAMDIKASANLFYIGRGLDYALSQEGSIKLKEISYIHSEAYAAGELKHGTISLITEGVPVIALATQKDVFAKMLSNVQEVRSRGGKVILITNNLEVLDSSICDYHISLPYIDDDFTPFCAAVVLQFIAYYTASLKGLDVDQPRNLAKSVTVE